MFINKKSARNNKSWSERKIQTNKEYKLLGEGVSSQMNWKKMFFSS